MLAALRSLSIASFATLPLAVVAAQPASLAECAAIEQSDGRLRCYDRLAPRPGDAATDAAPASHGEENPTREAPVEERLAEEREVESEGFALRPYRPNYLLPIAYNPDPNTAPYQQGSPEASLDPVEIKFQISIQFDIWHSMLGKGRDLYFAYTQLSMWQAYNRSESSPFRETNYEPEIGLSLATDFSVLGLTNRVVRVGFDHQSNGQSDPLSRSWNRIVAWFVLDRGNFAMALRPWIRIPEKSETDNNPDIIDYMGNGELYLFYKLRKNTLGMMLRNNLQSQFNRGAVQLDWSHPISRRLKLYVQYFNGYGETLIDYDYSTNRLGVGFMLTDWL